MLYSIRNLFEDKSQWIVSKKPRASLNLPLFLSFFTCLSWFPRITKRDSPLVCHLCQIICAYGACCWGWQTRDRGRDARGRGRKRKTERDDERAWAYCCSRAALIQQRKTPLQPDEHPSVFFPHPSLPLLHCSFIFSIIHWHFQTLCFASSSGRRSLDHPPAQNGCSHPPLAPARIRSHGESMLERFSWELPWRWLVSAPQLLIHTKQSRRGEKRGFFVFPNQKNPFRLPLSGSFPLWYRSALLWISGD